MVLKGHKYGVNKIVMHSTGRMMVSVGDENDRTMIVWDLIEHTIVSSNTSKKSQIRDIAMKKGSMFEFYTCGTEGHFKKWKLELGTDNQW